MLLIAHRGNTIDFPENTIQAFDSAFELGADGIEMDVMIENDEPIIVHNYIHPPFPYPKLSDVIEHFKNKGILEIEIKSYTLPDVDIILDCIKRANPPKFEITSSVYPILSYIRAALPHASIGAIFPNKFIEDWMTKDFLVEYLSGYMATTGANTIHVPPSYYDADGIQKPKKSYTVHHHIKSSDKEEYDRLVSLGIDCVTFDNIGLLKTLNHLPEV